MGGHPVTCSLRCGCNTRAAVATLVEAEADHAVAPAAVGTATRASWYDALVSQIMDEPLAGPSVGFRPGTREREVVLFDPSQEERLDVDVVRWGQLTGMLFKAQVSASSAWKMDPNRDRSSLAIHFTRGYPTPVRYRHKCECVALRNARELAEHLGYRDFSGS